jgi:hypothetical protein
MAILDLLKNVIGTKWISWGLSQKTMATINSSSR